jgi:CRP-like cAMP-binding protein
LPGKAASTALYNLDFHAAAYATDKLWSRISHRLLKFSGRRRLRETSSVLLPATGETMSQLSNHPGFRNQLLAKLSVGDLDLLRPHLEPVQLDVRHSLETANEPIKQVYFAESGFASVVAKDEGDRVTEVGIIGREGVTGLPVLLGDERSPNDTYIQLAGSGHLLPVAALRSAMERSGTLRATMLRFVHAMTIQMANTALANSKVKVDARLARWLLMAHDRVDGDKIELTHEFLALMLGVRRAGVTEALQVLEDRKLIRNSRGKVIIRNRKRLEEAANGSYGVPEAEYARLMGEPS